MGTIFAEQVLGVKNPSVALLSIGEEGGKGEQRVQEATELLTASDLQLPGQRRGQGSAQAPSGRGRVRRVRGQRHDQVLRGPVDLHLRSVPRRVQTLRRWGPIGYFFMRPGIARIRQRFDYERLGGSPLLGVKGTVLITHGRARRRMIGFAVEVGAAAAKAHIPDRIADALA